MSMNITKVSAYFRKVGEDKDAFYELKEDSSLAFDASNFINLAQGHPSIFFDVSDNGFYGSGYMQTSPFFDVREASTLIYPIKTYKAGKYSGYLRVKALSGSSISFSINVNSGISYPFFAKINSDWAWIPFDFIVEDNKIFNLGVSILSPNVLLDSILILPFGSNIPSFIEMQNKFLTLHFKAYDIKNDLVHSSLPVYSYKISTNITTDGWINFPVETLSGYANVNYKNDIGLGFFVSGASENFYLMLDYDKDINNKKYLVTYNNGLVVNNKNYAIKIYSFRESLDANSDSIITESPKLNFDSVVKFDNKNINPSFIQTEIENLNTDNSVNKVVLSLPDRIVSIIMDQSGSQTWNDSAGLRHDLTRKIVDRLKFTYPGNVKFNIVSFGATQIKINLFGIVESDNVNVNNIDQASSAFFSGQEDSYAGVRVIRKEGSPPLSPLDGEIVYEGFFEKAFDEKLIENQDYYYGVYTFDASGNFSDGKIINAVPRIREIPNGVGGIESRVLIGTGCRRENSAIALWHLNEQSDNIAFDFSDNQLNLKSANDLVWLNKNEVPSGVSGLRMNGASDSLYAFDNKYFSNNEITISAFVYPFLFDKARTIISRQSSNNNNLTFIFGINSDGKLFFTTNSLNYAYSTYKIEVNDWSHVCVTVNYVTKQVIFYINGVFAGSGVISLTGNYNQGPMNYYLGGKDSSFFGNITEISIFSEIKSLFYIQNASFIPATEKEKILDNGDRLVILKYNIAENFNYKNGKIFIVRKERKGPALFDYLSDPPVFKGFGDTCSNEKDGDIVYQTTTSAGSFAVSLPYKYIHDRVYEFKIFSQNTLGNYSLNSDSPLVSIKIPKFTNSDYFASSIPPIVVDKVLGASIEPGNKKTYITWDSTSAVNAEQVLIYWSAKNFPAVNQGKIESSSVLVFSGDVNSGYFVDRNVDNDAVSYYTILSADRYGNLSAPIYLSATPKAEYAGLPIPLSDVQNLSYEIIDENSLSLSWNSPVKLQKNIKAWFDERISIYAQITDDRGSPLSISGNMKLVADVSLNSSNLAEDVFAETINRESFTPKVEDCYILSSGTVSNGYLVGTFRMNPNIDVLSSIDTLNASIYVSYVVPDKNDNNKNVFELKSLPINLSMKNPLSIELINLGDNGSNFGSITKSYSSQSRGGAQVNDAPTGDFVRIICKQNVPLDSQSFIASGGMFFDPNKFKDFDGCYIRRTKPFRARLVVSYKGQPVDVNSAISNFAVFEASDPQCDPDDDDANPCSSSQSSRERSRFVPSFSNSRSRFVQPPATSLPLVLSNQTFPDGSVKTFSYVDVPLKAPRTPQAVMLFAKFTYNGLYSRKKMYIVFENILRVETTINSPESNCIDVVEQSAKVYLIDPDGPSIVNQIKKSIPDQQIVKWNLRKGRNAKDRPFYSKDNYSDSSGVFSFVRNGVAKNIYFGPACGVTWEIYQPCPDNVILLPELYAISASVMYDGLYAFEERPAIIYPPSSSFNSFGSRFLMSFPSFVNTLYADGYDLVKLTIYHDPNGPSPFGTCFRNCALENNRPLFVLNGGQVVDIESGDGYEILFGDEIKILFNNDIKEYEVSNEIKNIGFAQIPLKNNSKFTEVYFRINKFVGRPKKTTSSSQKEESNICSCIEVSTKENPENTLSVVLGRTTVNFNGESRYLNGGGGLKNGVPPTTIKLLEPLDINIVDIRRNGQSVQKVLCDGVSAHEIVFEVSFKGDPVPDGTPIYLTIGGTNPEKVALQSEIIYTKTILDGTRKKSRASAIVFPFSAESKFESQIQGEVNYDKRGDVQRSMTACITINYDPADKKESINQVENNEIQGDVKSTFDAQLYAFDSITGLWSRKSDMQHPRGALTLNWAFDSYNEYLFAIGGLDGRSVLKYNERYNIFENKWEPKTSMITPRFFHSSVHYGSYIYVFGGITVLNSNLLVSSSVERYDIYNDRWDILSDIPSDGFAMCSAVIVDNKVYFIGGVRKIEPLGGIRTLNDEILSFNFDTLKWNSETKFTGDDLSLYQRISPFAYLSDNNIKIVGGASLDISNQSLTFLTSALQYNIITKNITNDNNYRSLPVARYKGGTASINNNHYFIGGTNSKSSVLKIFEQVSNNNAIYDYKRLSDLPVSRTSFGCDSDNWRYVYSAGGISSGRPPGFLQINAIVNPSRIRLDGKQSATISVNLRDDAGEIPSKPVRVLVQGILTFKKPSSGSASTNSQQQQSSQLALRDILIYPVVFSSNDFVVANGSGATVMLPRSEDLLKIITENTQESSSDLSLQINEGEIRNPYSIKVKITVIDDFYYGQTVVDIQDNIDSDILPQSAQDSIVSVQEQPTSSSNQESSSSVLPVVAFKDCRSISGSQTIPSDSSEDVNDTLDPSVKISQSIKNSNTIFNLNPTQKSQLESPEVSYYSDIEWIPQSKIHLNMGDYDNTVAVLNKLKSSIPFGGSPLYDSVISVASISLDETLDVYKKTIYINTDNEENLSLNSVDSAIEEVQSIDGFGSVPVVINNFSVVSPVTVSALVSRTDTSDLEKIATETGGQSQTVLDAKYIDDIVNNSVGRIAGSVGWGSYECTIDLGKISVINKISLDYELYLNTIGSWKVAYSNDGYNYSDYSEQFNSDQEVKFDNIDARYLKFHVNLLSGLSAYVQEEYSYIPTPGRPALTKINISYSLPSESYIYVNAEKSLHSPQQISVSVSASESLGGQVLVGASTSNATEWRYYENNSQPVVDKFGKIVIPIRYKSSDQELDEPLENVDGYTWRALYGKWSDDSEVTIKDSSGNEIDKSEYIKYPKFGLITFNRRQTGKINIYIKDKERLKIGIKIVNRDYGNPIKLHGFGYLYNTNVDLPTSLESILPIIQNLSVLPSSPTVYEKISINYKYFSSSQKEEVLNNAQIKWYINGVEIEYLRNLREWNNIDNNLDPIWIYGFSFKQTDITQGLTAEQYARSRKESLIKVGDTIYAKVRVSDGSQLSEEVRSKSVVVQEDPPFINSLVIKGKSSNGSVSDIVTTSTRAFADFTYFANQESSNSQITWFVNGVEFKKGVLGSSVGGISNNEILPGEVKNNLLGIAIGNILEVEIIPASKNIYGQPVRSAAISIQNSPPSVRNVEINPKSRISASSSLVLSYSYVDADSQGSTQTDQSYINWYRKPRSASEFVEVSALKNSKIVLPSYTSSGDLWKATVIPFDGLSVGISVDSNTVDIA